MKKLLSAALVLSLLGSSAAFAAPYGHGNFGGRGNYGGHGDFGGRRDFGHSDHRGGNDGALIAGVGLFALAAILATSQNHSEPRDYDDDYRAPPPPPAYGYGYGNDYGPGYGNDYGPGYYGR